MNQEGGRKPWNSVNFVCAHDGFTLADLVAYNDKHNLANGEDNNDGENHNNSWNCGQVYIGNCCVMLPFGYALSVYPHVKSKKMMALT